MKKSITEIIKKVVLILIAIPLYIFMGIFDIVKLPIILLCIGLAFLVSWARNDFDWNLDRKIALGYMLLGIELITLALYDKNIFLD